MLDVGVHWSELIEVVGVENKEVNDPRMVQPLARTPVGLASSASSVILTVLASNDQRQTLENIS